MGEETQVPEKRDLVADENQLPPVALNQEEDPFWDNPDCDDCGLVAIGHTKKRNWIV